MLELVDADGVTMADAFRRFGLDPGLIPQAASPPGRIAAYLEVHIEQGPVLEAWDLPVGVVSAIAGQSRLSVTFEGRAGHAGTSPMDLRRDALTAAAELILQVESLARSVDGLRGTVGSIAAKPGATNVVPGSVSLSLDVRHATDEARHAGGGGPARRRARDRRAAGAGISGRPARKITGRSRRIRGWRDRLASAVRDAGVEPRRLVSGAGHDAAIVAEIAPMTMLFVRSPGGISHHPDERVDPADARVALDVLVRWLAGGPLIPSERE